MNRATRAPLQAVIAVSIAVLALLLSAPGAFAEATATTASSENVTTVATTAYPGVQYTKESVQEYEKQLAAGEVQAAEFNKKVRSLHIVLKNGKYVLVHYSAGEEPKLQSDLTAKGIHVTILSKQAAQKEVKKPAHKLRYIAGGILLVVIIVVAVVLIVDRKRKREAE